MTQVQLLGVPTDLYRLISEHHDEVARELKLLDPQTSSGELSVRLIELGPLLGSTFKALVRPLRAAMAEAREHGEPTADAVLDFTDEEAGTLRQLHELLDLADEASRAGELLALPLDPRAAALRAWLVDEVGRQVLEGAEPRPWAGGTA
jgi:hypothetical protein